MTFTLISYIRFADGNGNILPLCHNRTREECEAIQAATPAVTYSDPRPIKEQGFKILPTAKFIENISDAPGYKTTAANGDEAIKAAGET